VAAKAYDWTPDDKTVKANLDRLAATVADEQLEVSHRRFFVKAWIRLLDQLRLGTARVLSDDEIRALVRDEQVLLLEDDVEDQKHESEPTGQTFLGIPLKKKPPSKKG